MLVNTYYEPEIVGGAEKSVQKLAEAYVKSGNEVTVLCTCKNEKKSRYINGVKVIRIHPNNFGRRYDLQFEDFSKYPLLKHIFYRLLFITKAVYLIDTYNPRNFKIISEIIKTEAPDVIHTNGLYEITPVVWKCAKKNGVKVVHTVRDYYLLCINGNLKSSRTNQVCKSPRFLCSFRQRLNIRFLRWVDVCTSPSKATSQIITESLKKPVITVYNAIDYDEEYVTNLAKKKINALRRKKNFSIVYIGALSSFKGVDWLLENFMKISGTNIELHIAGSGPLESRVKECALLDNRIIFHGFLSEQQLNSLLEKSDILICPSMWSEPFGRIILDAYKNAMPVITTGFGGMGEIVDPYKTGLILDLNNENSLKESLTFYIDNLDNLKNGIEQTVDKLKEFSVKEQESHFMDIYR